jgi:hypothetical protein
MLMGYQDFKHRAITWYLFPILFGLLFMRQIFVNSQLMPDLLWNILLNIFLIVLIICITSIYFLFKGFSLKSFFTTKIGIGDLLFFICITPQFDILNLCFFLIFGSVISLLYQITTLGLSKYFKLKYTSSIPYAGILALLLIPVLLIGDFQLIDLFFRINLN